MLTRRAPEPLEPEFRHRLDRSLAATWPGVDAAERDRRIRATVDFLRACAESPGLELAPAPIIDEVFHTMVLETAHYRAFCRGLGVAFIDHTPFPPDAPAPRSVAETIDHMRAAGHSLSGVEDLWPRSSAAQCCGSCAVM